jgi:hypothetical protein
MFRALRILSSAHPIAERGAPIRFSDDCLDQDFRGS